MSKTRGVRTAVEQVVCRVAAAFLACMLMMAATAQAHSGRTDGSGGHKDNKNKSGLGYYHYHCNGKPAHLHTDGICPYDPKDQITVKNMPASLYVGDAVALTWTVEAYSGSDWVEWSSSDESVATVSAKGRITAVAPGKVEIMATLRNGSKSYPLKVSNRLITEVKVSAPKDHLPVGSIMQASAAISPANATNCAMKWSSSNENVAIALPDGKILALGEGKTTITAEAQDGSKKRSSMKLTATAAPRDELDADVIMAQLPEDYQFAVKPGSAAAAFVQQLGLPFTWLEMLLKEGTSGQDVLSMKVRMQELGYFSAGASLSEQYNATTTERVKLFQQVNGLRQTGTADTDMLLLLFSDAAKANPDRK